MFSAACQPKRPSRSTSPNPNARFLRRAHLPLPDIDLVPARPRASDGRADTRAASFRRDASISGRTGRSRQDGVCHVYPQQAFASSEQFSARVALFHRCCLLTVAISGTSADKQSAGVGSAFTGNASRSRGAAGRTTNRTERLYSHRHGHGAPAPTHRDRKAGCARSGHNTAPTAANINARSDGNARRDHGKSAGYDRRRSTSPLHR